MTVFQKEFKVDTKEGQVSYIDITNSIHQTITESGIQSGICTVITAHTTCSIFFEEDTHDKDENGVDYLQLDLNTILEKIIPPHLSADSYHYPGEKHYQEVESWPNPEEWLPNGDRSALWNGDAHLKATIIGSSETLAVVDGKLAIGKTGYVYFADFDKTRERTRKYRVVIIGE